MLINSLQYFMRVLLFTISSVLAVFTAQASTSNTPPMTALELLGKTLFFDTRLSQPEGLSCAGCHDPAAGFSAPQKNKPVSQGVNSKMHGNRNAPTVAYAAFSPEFHFDKKQGLYLGGQFLDGRATTLAHQLVGPLTSPLEMGNKNKRDVVNKIRKLGYENQFKHVFGQSLLSDPQKGFEQISEAIIAYEKSREVNSFSSKYDYFLAGKLDLSTSEKRGLKIFESDNKGNCAACHPHTSDKTGVPPLFTDFSYDNLGVPANPANPFYTMNPSFNPQGRKFIDKGLGTTTKDKKQDGKFKVPTLRNIAMTSPYMHNGVFQSLREVVEFYNSRDVDKKWPAPEVASNVNTEELGDLKLTEQEIDDLVSFLKTLNDGYQWPDMAQTK